MKSREDLLHAIAAGATPEYVHFWGHRPAASGAITKTCFSQWYDAPFDAGGRRYATAEHFMMARKAELFGDLSTRDRILQAKSPGEAKALGREVVGFDTDAWTQHRWQIVVDANLHKFGQHERLRHFLLGTREKVLVEASPNDAIWGIGLAADAPEAQDPAQWPGLNLLGFALMEVRSRLRAVA